MLLADQASPDTLQAPFARLQKDLIEALQTQDSIALGRLLARGFRAYDTRVSERRSASPGGGVQPQEFSYFEVMAGALTERLDMPVNTFEAVDAGPRVRVLATGPGDAVRTTWGHQNGRWQALQLIILQPEAVRRQLEKR